MSPTSRAKRGYSRKFTPSRHGHRRYLLDKIPVKLWDDAKREARRQGLSMRALLLVLLDGWLSLSKKGVLDNPELKPIIELAYSNVPSANRQAGE